MIITLRPDQQDLKGGIYNSWAHGYKNVLGVLPTGGGKSVIVSDIALDASRQGIQQVIIAHRNELVSQMSMHIANRGIYHKIIGPDAIVAQIIRMHRNNFGGQSYINPSALCSVAGVDTIVHRAESLKQWAAQQDRWTIDEAHHVVSENKWHQATKLFTNAHGLGVTATPCRADGQGLGADFDGVFDDMIIGPDMRTLIKLGALSDYEIACPESDLHLTDDDIGAKGDYSPAKMRTAAKKSRIVGDVVREYCSHAFGKQAICFATDVETAGDIAKSFNAAGIRAAALSGETPVAVREKFITEFKTGKLLILVNVDLFDEGFDCPRCEVVIMARPTASLGKYLQMFGRALRIANGKQYGLIIDHVSNVVRHHLPDKPRVWTLARRDKRGKQALDPEDIPLTVCRTCTKPYERFYSCCPHCGAYPPLPEVRDRSIMQVEGNLFLLDRFKLEQMRQATVLASAGAAASGANYAAGEIAGKANANRQIEKIAAQKRLSDMIGIWAAVERSKGRPDDQSYKRFYFAACIDVLGALSADRTRQEYDELTTKIEGWLAK